MSCRIECMSCGNGVARTPTKVRKRLLRVQPYYMHVWMGEAAEGRGQRTCGRTCRRVTQSSSGRGNQVKRWVGVTHDAVKLWMGTVRLWMGDAAGPSHVVMDAQELH